MTQVRRLTAFEAAEAAIKAEFEALPGDCLVMVVAVNGLRPQPPHLSRSLEGYCIVVSPSGCVLFDTRTLREKMHLWRVGAPLFF